MFVLLISDSLLKDLEATIPPAVTCGPKATTGTGPSEDEFIELNAEMNGDEVNIVDYILKLQFLITIG